MRRFWAQALQIARKDLRSEFRSGEVLMITLPFGAVALLLIPLAVGIDAELLRSIGPGMYWSIVLLFGVLVTVRQSSADGPAQQDVLAMLGIDAAAQFTGGAAATALLLLLFEATLAPVAIALYNIALEAWFWLLPLIPLVATGLGLLGTLASAIAASAASPMLVIFIVIPLSVPLLLAATQVVEGLQVDAAVLGWFLLLIVMDLLLAVAGVASAGPLQEASK